MEQNAAESKRVTDALRDVIELNTDDAPTEPGVYRLPCGACHVDFFVGPDGVEHWLVAGDATAYTRATVAISRHGDYPWTRLYSLEEAARQIQRLADFEGTGTELAVARLAQADLLR